MVQGRQVSQNAGPAFVVSLKLRTSPGTFLRTSASPRTSPGASKIEGRTATRPWAHQYGTLDTEWQWGLHCHSHLNVPSRTFTAEWQ